MGKAIEASVICLTKVYFIHVISIITFMNENKQILPRILCVDDDETIRNIVKDTLKEHYDVVLAETRTRAVIGGGDFIRHIFLGQC